MFSINEILKPTTTRMGVALATLLVITACSKKPEAEAPVAEKPAAEATATADAPGTTAPTAEDIAANPEVEGMELTE